MGVWLSGCVSAVLELNRIRNRLGLCLGLPWRISGPSSAWWRNMFLKRKPNHLFVQLLHMAQLSLIQNLLSRESTALSITLITNHLLRCQPDRAKIVHIVFSFHCRMRTIILLIPVWSWRLIPLTRLAFPPLRWFGAFSAWNNSHGFLALANRFCPQPLPILLIIPT